ncbi:MAG: thermonuclease family protein [Propionivibrio sp.]
MRPAAKIGAFCLLTLAALAVSAETFEGRVSGAVNGDTLMVADHANRPRQVRLLGIDAPGVTQAFGQNARTALSALAANQTLSADCRKLGAQDVCRARIGGKDVALELVRAGMAWWSPQHASLQTDEERASYQQAEFNAKIRRFGLWNSKNPVPPWQWRFP